MLGEGIQVFDYDALTDLSDARINLGWPGTKSRGCRAMTSTNIETAINGAIAQEYLDDYYGICRRLNSLVNSILKKSEKNGV